jgi:hypothetical protein
LLHLPRADELHRAVEALLAHLAQHRRVG